MVLFHGFSAKESELKGEFGVQGKPGGGCDMLLSVAQEIFE